MAYFFSIHKSFDDPDLMESWINRFETTLGKNSPWRPAGGPADFRYAATPAGRININWDPEAVVLEDVDFELYMEPGHRYEIPENDRASAEALYDAIKRIGNPTVQMGVTTKTRTEPPHTPEEINILVSKLMEEQPGVTREQAEQIFADLVHARQVADEDPTVWTRKAEGPPKPVRGRTLTYRHTPENIALEIAGKEKYPEGRPWEQTALWKEFIDSVYTKEESVDPDEWRRMYRAWRNKTPAQRLAQKIYNESRKGQIQHENYDASDKANIGFIDPDTGVFKIGARKKYRTSTKGKTAVAKAQVNQRLRTTRSRQLAREGMGGYQIEITLWKEGLYPGFKSLERFILKKLKAGGIINPSTGEEYLSDEGVDFGEGYPSENYEGDET